MDRPTLVVQLWRRKLWVAVGLVVAGLAAGSRLTQVSLHYTANTQVFIGEHTSLTSASPEVDTSAETTRAQALADMSASPEVREDIARAARLPASQIAVDAPLWGDLERIQQWDTGEKRANQIIAEKDPYRLELSDNFTAPIIDVVAQAPSPAVAARLAGAVRAGLRSYLAGVETAAGVPPARQFVVTQLAPVATGAAGGGGPKNVAGFTFAAVFVLWCGVVLLAGSLASDVRAVRRRSKVRRAPERSSGSGAGGPGPNGLSTSAE